MAIKHQSVGTELTQAEFEDATLHIGGEETLITTADVSESAAVFASITELSFNMLANKTYIIEAWLIFQSAGTAAGIAFGCSGPAAPVAVGIVAHIPIAFTLYASCCTLCNNTYDTGTPSVSVGAANTNYPSKLDIIVQNGANAGAFILRFKTEVSGTAVTVKAGSVMRYKRVN
ncbi:MAG: hypothetical protein Q8J68_14720 [Methanolobus sp.]|uniref:hypothetical protein n=1 Tax=Methanolobus sp. TaxID=1874737 RepID=UPI00272FF71F|nr:hypothetical protein [Methanolobus sp.]MDP2218528.1 hypothetical protein [Methanolobus sp.]